MVNYSRGSGNYKSSNVHVVILKADETVNNSETLINSALNLSLKVNKRYSGFLMLRFVSPSAADMDYTWAAITGATNAGFEVGGGTANDEIALATESTIATSGNNQIIMLSFSLKMGSTAGTLQFKFAQTTATVGNTKVFQGSTLVVFEDKV